MIYRYLSSLAPKFVSKWLVLTFDVTLVLLTFFMVYFIRFHLTVNFNIENFLMDLPIVAVLSVVSFMAMGTYKRMIRYTGMKDLLNIFGACLLLGFLAMGVVAINKAYAILPGITIPKSIIILHTFLSFVVLAITSIIVGLAYRFVNCKLKARKNILIYGAGESGIMTQYALASNMDKNTKIVAFIDDDLRKVGNSINGTRVIETGAV